ncbi:type II toxin-antitoxin system death-on-curing family toxin [Micromonospora marina]|uniref:Death on curing protein n=1 Tax=Micromonospora marina TaxID=307120 RepID=A0A1C4Z1B8_9ACTN|nr:Fic family protein [Micromonospora marina]SCF26819.1 death on curing protein [Micromonospora marina]
MINYLEVDDLVEIASIVLGETPQVRDFGLLSSAVVRPATVAFGQEAYPDLWTKAAALPHSVCMNHALTDGNKRLAWAAARVFLALNEVPIQDVDVDQAEALVMSVASGTLTEVSDIARELRKLYV